MLDTQYRMHPDICRFPSQHFYSDCLLTDDSVARRMKHFTLESLFLYNITNSRHEYDTASSSYNADEAKYVQSFCQSLIIYLAQQPNPPSSEDENDEDDESDTETDTTSSSNSTQSDEDDSADEEDEEGAPLSISLNDRQAIEAQRRIAVITPYKAQARLLRSYLPPYIEILTADGAQGKEKDIIIVSCVRSGGNIGFLDDDHRLNVTLTRAKYGLYIFGNLTEISKQQGSWQALVNHAKWNGAFSITVARQVGQPSVGVVLGTHLEQVDVLRAPRRARRKGQPLVLGQRVDGGGLAGVAAADEGDLGALGHGQLVQPAGGDQKTCAVQPGQGFLGGG